MKPISLSRPVLVLLCVGAASAVESTPAPAPAVASTPVLVAPPTVLVVDASRSMAADPAVLDRVRLLDRLVLPALGRPTRTVAFDAVVRDPAVLTDERFADRHSDYLAALRAVFTSANGPQPGRVLLVGDGRIEAVGPAMPEEYRAWVSGDATRDRLNQAVAEQARTLLTPLLAVPTSPLILLDPAAPMPGLATWIVEQAAATVVRLRLDQPLVTELLAALGRNGGIAPGVEIFQPVDGALILPEGTTAVLVVADGVGEVVLSDANGAALGPAAGGLAAEVLDDQGPARAWRISGAEAGTTVRISAPAGVQLAAIVEVRMAWTVALARLPHTTADWAGDPLTVTETLTRAPGGVAVSAATREAIFKSRTWHFDAVPQPEITQDVATLPATAGKGELKPVFAAPWAERITSAPTALAWTVAPPLTLSGKFALDHCYDGTPIELRFTRAGGKRPLPADTVLPLLRADGIQLALPLVAEGDVWVVRHTFTAEERGTWRIDTTKAISGDHESGAWVVPDDGATLAVRRNWWPLILGVGLPLLVALGALVWWLRTRPRLRDEVLVHADGVVRLRDLPGAKPATISLGLKGFGGAIHLHATRTGIVIGALTDGSSVWLNGQPAVVGASMVPGMDIEVAPATGRAMHARFFASAEQASAWTAEQAAIAVGTGDAELVILEP